MTELKTCGTCKYSRDFAGELGCDCEESEAYCCEMMDDDGCECWEAVETDDVW